MKLDKREKLSRLMKERHQLARQRREIYSFNYGGEGVRYSDFLKKRSPLDEKIIAYKVSFQISYINDEGSGVVTEPETYYLYALEGIENETSITNNTKDMVSDMKDKYGNTLNEGLREAVKRNTKVDIEKARGFERDDEINISSLNNKETIYNEISRGGVSLEGIDNKVKIKKKVKGDFKAQTNMSLDLLHYM